MPSWPFVYTRLARVVEEVGVGSKKQLPASKPFSTINLEVVAGDTPKMGRLLRPDVQLLPQSLRIPAWPTVWHPCEMTIDHCKRFGAKTWLMFTHPMKASCLFGRTSMQSQPVGCYPKWLMHSNKGPSLSQALSVQLNRGTTAVGPMEVRSTCPSENGGEASKCRPQKGSKPNSKFPMSVARPRNSLALPPPQKNRRKEQRTVLGQYGDVGFVLPSLELRHSGTDANTGRELHLGAHRFDE